MNLAKMPLSQKLLLGLGAFAAFVFLTGSASASTSPAGAAGGSNATTPNAGDRLLVITTQTGLGGRLYIRTAPGTQNAQVALANHGDTLTATGQVQTAADGTVWWQVTNSSGQTGWSETNYLQDQGPGGS
jgi:hypothetical protein